MPGRAPSPKPFAPALLVAVLTLALLALTPALAAAKPKPVTQAQLRKALKQARAARQQAQQAFNLAVQALAGEGVTVNTSQIADGAVTAPKLAPDSVVAGKIAPGAINHQDLFGSGVVGPGALGAGAINAQSLFGPGVIGPGALGTGAISAQTMFGNGVIGAGALGVGAVHNPNVFATGVVGPGVIGDGAIDAGALFSNGVIPGSAISPGAVDTAAIANGAVGPAQTGVIPAARITFNNTQNTAIPDNDQTDTPLTWNQEVFDTAGLHSGANEAMVAPIAGVYSVTATVELNNGQNESNLVDTYFDADIEKNGDTVAYTQLFSSQSDQGQEFWSPMDLNLSGIVALDAGDEVTVDVSQDSGTGTVLGMNGGDQLSSFAIAWLGPATAP